MKEVKIMKKLFIVFSLVVALISFMSFNAVALPITGAISFSGTAVQNNLDLSLATAFTEFTNAVVSTTGGTGDYALVLSGHTIAMTPFTFRPALAPNPLVPLWTFDFAGKTYSFDATGLNINYSDYNTISMDGTGTAHITGFDSTPAKWYYSSNGAGGTSSFSASADVAAVPEPATMLLLGLGLLGIGTSTRIKIKK
jgi:hypothetical protein